MPKPNHRARSTAAAAAGGGGGGPIDADWKYFLDNVREEGHSYSVRVPADGANPSYYLQYEKSPTNGAASTSSVGGAGRKRRRIEEEESSSGEPALHIEEDYLVFIQNVRPVGNGGFLLEHDGKVIRYDASAAVSSDESADESVMGAPDPNPRRRKTKIVEEEEVKNEVAVPTRENDFTMVKEDHKKKKGKKVVGLPARGEDGAMVAEEDPRKKLKKDFSVHFKGKDGTTPAKNLKDKKDGKKEVIVPAKGKDGHFAEVIKVEEEDEQLQIVPSVEKLATTTRLTNLSDGHKTDPRIASGSDGVIWPIHINDREESDFKQRLIHVLNKPFSQGEYDKLFGMATVRNPLTRERRTRCGVKYYYSQHEKAKSYFDCYPEMTKLTSASYISPNKLKKPAIPMAWLCCVAFSSGWRILGKKINSGHGEVITNVTKLCLSENTLQSCYLDVIIWGFSHIIVVNTYPVKNRRMEMLLNLGPSVFFIYASFGFCHLLFCVTVYGVDKKVVVRYFCMNSI